MIFPAFFIAVICIIKASEILFGISFAEFGIKPLKVEGLLGIITAPLLHSDLKHLVGNCVPLFVLMTGLFYFYRDCSMKVFISSYLLTGILTWLMGRGQSVHIGASGLVYALILFHLVSALLRRRRDLTAYSLVVILLYGSFIWGFFPDFYPERNISRESHLSGAIVGIILAIIYKDSGPQRIVWEWDEDEEEEGEENSDREMTNEEENEKNVTDA